MQRLFEELVEVQEQDRITETDDAKQTPPITARRTDRTRRRKLVPDADRGEDRVSVPVSRVPRVAFVEQLRKQQPDIPVLFLETTYHFAEVLEYRDRLAREWGLNVFNLQAKAPVLHLEHGELRAA